MPRGGESVGALRNSGKRDYPRANHRWAHFEIAHEIARGNMGIVFRARDTRTDKDVALKVKGPPEGTTFEYWTA